MYMKVNTLRILYVYEVECSIYILYIFTLYILYVYGGECSMYTLCVWRWILYIYTIFILYIYIYGGVENWKEMKDINPTLCIIAHLNLNRVGGIVRGEG